MKFQLLRLCGYVLGFVLFYAPYALAQRLIYCLFYGSNAELSIHDICFRIPIEHILDGRILTFNLPYTIGTFVLLLSAVLFGPIYCGRLCPAGYLSELTSKIIPAKFQIDWTKHVSITPIRYGMLLGFLLLPLFGGVAACSFCNYYVFDLLINHVAKGYFVSLSGSMLFTTILWLGVFGLFTKGGRGFCNFFCPVGAALNLCHRIGCCLPFAMGMHISKNHCIGCGKCENKCPMGAIQLEEKQVVLSKDNCICCGVCSHNCPVKAIEYGRNKHEK